MPVCLLVAHTSIRVHALLKHCARPAVAGYSQHNLDTSQSTDNSGWMQPWRQHLMVPGQEWHMLGIQRQMHLNMKQHHLAHPLELQEPTHQDILPV